MRDKPTRKLPTYSHIAADLFADARDNAAAHEHSDENWRRNNQKIRERDRLTPAEKYEVLRTSAVAVLALILVAAFTVGLAALAPVTVGQFVALNEAGTMLDVLPIEEFLVAPAPSRHPPR